MQSPTKKVLFSLNTVLEQIVASNKKKNKQYNLTLKNGINWLTSWEKVNDSTLVNLFLERSQTAAAVKDVHILQHGLKTQ